MSLADHQKYIPAGTYFNMTSGRQTPANPTSERRHILVES